MMFDNIGRTKDPEYARRRAGSVLTTALVAGIGVGVLAWQAAHQPEPIPPPPIGEMVQLVTWEANPLKAPEPAPKAGGGGSRHPNASPSTPRPPPSQDLDLDERPVKPPPPAPAQSEGTGDGDGGGAGDGDGTAEGDGDGTCTTPGACGGGAPATAVYRKPEVRLRLDLVYPSEATGLGLRQVRCRALVHLDARGRPVDVRVRHCPEVFHAPTRAGLMRWRWRPAKDRSGRKLSSSTQVWVTYRLD